MNETICNKCLIESSLRGEKHTHCIHAVAELEREKEKIAEQERLDKEAQLTAKQAERRELIKEVALKCIRYSDSQSDFVCYENTAQIIANDILRLMEKFSKEV